MHPYKTRDLATSARQGYASSFNHLRFHLQQSLLGSQSTIVMAAHNMRPPIPHDDYRRQMPPSPFDMDPRDPRVMSAPFDSSRMGMDGPDYFSAINGGPFGNSGPQRMPMPPMDPEMMMGYGQPNVDDLVRRYVLPNFQNYIQVLTFRSKQNQPPRSIREWTNHLGGQIWTIATENVLGWAVSTGLPIRKNGGGGESYRSHDFGQDPAKLWSPCGSSLATTHIA